MTSDPRRRLGDIGERAAAEHLVRGGYAILERNFRNRSGELDLVATSARALVFCEVKTRIAGGSSGPATPVEAVGAAKRRRLRRLAAEWLRERSAGRPRPPELRFDVIGVVVAADGRLLALEHLEGAF